MKIVKDENSNNYNIVDVTQDELCGIDEMISSASLPIKRHFYNFQKEIQILRQPKKIQA